MRRNMSKMALLAGTALVAATAWHMVERGAVAGDREAGAHIASTQFDRHEGAGSFDGTNPVTPRLGARFLAVPSQHVAPAVVAQSSAPTTRYTDYPPIDFDPEKMNQAPAPMPGAAAPTPQWQSPAAAAAPVYPPTQAAGQPAAPQYPPLPGTTSAYPQVPATPSYPSATMPSFQPETPGASAYPSAPTYGATDGYGAVQPLYPPTQTPTYAPQYPSTPQYGAQPAPQYGAQPTPQAPAYPPQQHAPLPYPQAGTLPAAPAVPGYGQYNQWQGYPGYPSAYPYGAAPATGWGQGGWSPYATQPAPYGYQPYGAPAYQGYGQPYGTMPTAPATRPAPAAPSYQQPQRLPHQSGNSMWATGAHTASSIGAATGNPFATALNERPYYGTDRTYRWGGLNQ